MPRRISVIAMRRIGIGKGGLAVAALTTLLLGSMVEVGARTPRERRLAPYRLSAPLDYSAPPAGGFTPLTHGYIRRILGVTSPLLGDLLGTEGRTLRAERRAPPFGPLVVDHPLVNDSIDSAYRVSRIPFTARTDTSNATRDEAADPSDCASFGPTIWYRYVAPASTGVVVRARGGSPVAIAAYAGTITRSSRAIACSSDASGSARLVAPLVEGTAYLFQITMQLPGRLVFSMEPTSVTTIASVDDRGRRADAWSTSPRISGNGRYVIFRSRAHLGVGIATPQIFLRDVLTGRTELVSRTADGEVPDAASWDPSISYDGRYVVWSSTATNVVPQDTTPDFDAFLRDRLRGTTDLVSVDDEGPNPEGTFPEISGDGRYVAFRSGHGTNYRHWLGYVRDRARGRTTHVTETEDGGLPNRDSAVSAISADGRSVLIGSHATNMMPGVPSMLTARGADAGFYGGTLFVRDLDTWELTHECVSARGEHANERCTSAAISENGRFTVFWSAATNLIEGLPPAPPGTGVAMYCYVRDRLTGAIEIVNYDELGRPTPEIWRRQGPGVPDEWSLRNSISYDGRFVGFEGRAQLLAGDTNGAVDAFVRDRSTSRTIIVSEAPDGSASRPGPTGNIPENASPYCSAPVDARCVFPIGSSWSYVSADGSVVAFQSSATNLVPIDLNQAMDIFVRFLGTRP